MISQIKYKNDVCSQEVYGYGSILVLITPFIEHVHKVTIKINFNPSKTVCKIYKLSILMAVKVVEAIQNPIFCSSSVRKNRNLVKEKSGKFIDSQKKNKVVWEP